MQEILLTDVPNIPTADYIYQRLMKSPVKGFKENALYTHAAFVHDLTPEE